MKKLKLTKLNTFALSVVLLFGFASCKPEIEYRDVIVEKEVDKIGDEIAPANVTNLKATAKDSCVLLTWTEATDKDVYGYEVSYNGTSSINRAVLPALDSKTMIVGNGTGGCYVSGLTNGAEYTFTVKTVDTSGNKSTGVNITATAGETKPRPEPTEQGLDALQSLKAVEGFEHVYTVEYDGDYLLDDVISSNLKTSDELVTYLSTHIPSWKLAKESGIPLTINVSGAGCCSIAASHAGSAGGKIFGRNFDYPNGTAMILHTMPYKGYESVSTSYPYFVTGNLWWEPAGNRVDDAISLGLIYAPLDGLNEKGLYMSILQLDNEETNQTDSNKNDVQTTVAVRYILDNAASVDEALEILRGFNMHNVFNTAYHYAIADNTGKSVVVEYINNEMKVTDTKVVTNFYLTDSTKNDESSHSYINSKTRYDAAKNAGEAVDWNMTPEQMRDALKAAKAIHDPLDDSFVSIWSAVFEPSAKKVTYYFREDYTKYVEVTF